MNSKINQLMKGKYCLFPEAIKPWQKITCMVAGITTGTIICGTIITIYLTEKETKIFHNTARLPFNKVDKTLNIKKYSAAFYYYFLNYGLLLPFPIWASPLIYTESKNFYNNVKGTKYCCNIIRRTWGYSAKMTFYGLIGFVFPLMSL